MFYEEKTEEDEGISNPKIASYKNWLRNTYVSNVLLRKHFPTPAVFLSAFVLLAYAGSAVGLTAANENVGIVAADIQPIAADTVRINIVFVNHLPTAEGKVTLSFSNRISLSTEGRNWECTQNGRTCFLPVNVIGQEKISFDFRLKEYFDVDYLDVFFAVANSSVGSRIMLSHIQEPGAITAQTLANIGLAALVVGGVVWLLVLWAITVKKAAQLRFLASLVRRYLLLSSVFANFLVAAGLALSISPGISMNSAVIFSVVFAGGFLALLNYLPAKASVPVMSKEEVERERRRLQDMLTAAKIKLMRREIDDATYNKIVQECEMQLVKLSAVEKELS